MGYHQLVIPHLNNYVSLSLSLDYIFEFMPTRTYFYTHISYIYRNNMKKL